MRDLHALADEIRLAGKFAESISSDPYARHVNILRLARLLRNETVASTLEEVLATAAFTPLGKIEEHWASYSAWVVEERIRVLVARCEEAKEIGRNPPGAPPGISPSLARAVGPPLDELSVAVDNLTAVPPSLNVATELDAVYEPCKRAAAQLGGIGYTPMLLTALNRVTEEYHEFRRVIDSLNKRQTDALLLARMFSLADLKDRLLQHEDLMEKIFLAEDPPANALDVLAGNASIIQPSARYLADVVAAKLEERGSRRYILNRALTWLQHFECMRLRALLRLRENTGRYETILQRELDRLLFFMGYFPIIHFEGGGGEVDSLIDVAKEMNQTPILMELKQVIRMDGESAVDEIRRAIVDGVEQLRMYEPHIASNPRWRNIEPVVVLFHTAFRPKVEFPPSVLAVYLGNKTLSGAERRERDTPY